MAKPLVGISSCLTGQKVRYDGDHKFNTWIHTQIAPYVNLLPICPEAAIGMGIPRPPIQIRHTPTGLRALGRDNADIDVTDPLLHFADTINRVYPHLCGYIFQSRSPSCGFRTTPIYNTEQKEIARGSGLVARRLSEQRPDLPIVNDTDLDEAGTERFLREVMSRFNQHNPGIPEPGYSR
ncbi:MAG: DUF523 domain-containing protein [Ketobacteraceae bacterium]|nr:DUF523 domain-containing protein [Ketobacteraceae bacterium]